ncbi:MAG TPA: acyl-CoA dehydrogenase [Polyangiales bacterium]|nr:acyl-CoA dehydrogenase [Polyangiales bacterium]
MSQTLFDDRDVDFLLYAAFDAEALCRLPYFAEHSRQTFDLYLAAARKLARELVFPTYKPMDEFGSRFEGGRVRVHPAVRELLPRFAELGVLNATRPAEVEGQQLPACVSAFAAAYVMAANLSAYGYCMLTSGAAHLIEAFGSSELQERYMRPMYAGRFTGTMALTEPQAGSSLADVQTRAQPMAAGHYLISGNKVFISGGDQDATENIVHLTLARIAGAPGGIRGVSLFAVPQRRFEGEALVDNDCRAAGVFHKLGWRGIPSIALNFGEAGDCHGYLVGEPNRGIEYMFQMMNEARINIGIHGVATASVAYRTALEYANTRLQGRAAGSSEPVPIIAHADVRRMLLRQKAIVEGGLALVLSTARYQDLAQHAQSAAERGRAQQLLDLLTPLAKTFPAEYGFEANVLALQIHGGYGYTSEYLPEAWLRDQKLNSIHEGTTGIQSLDLLGRKVIKGEARSVALLQGEVSATVARARAAGVPEADCEAVSRAMAELLSLSRELAARAPRDPEAALRHSADYLEALSIGVVGWMWLLCSAVAHERLHDQRGDREHSLGKCCAADYWFRTELPRVSTLCALCRDGDDSYARMQPEWF